MIEIDLRGENWGSQMESCVTGEGKVRKLGFHLGPFLPAPAAMAGLTSPLEVPLCSPAVNQ